MPATGICRGRSSAPTRPVPSATRRSATRPAPATTGLLEAMSSQVTAPAAQRKLQADPVLAGKIQKLIDAGIVKTA